MTTIKLIPNPFSNDGRETVDRSDVIGRTVADVLQEYPGNWRVVHDRLGALDEERAKEVWLCPNDELLLLPQTEEGVTWAAVGAWMLQAAVVAAVSFGINYAISALMKSKPVTNNSDASDTQTYGWDGISNTANAGIPLPLIYGEHLIGGNYINVFSVMSGNYNYLYCLIALAEGEVESIAGLTQDADWVDGGTLGDSIYINDQPIEEYDDVTVSVRMGKDNQNVIPGFGDLHNITQLNTMLKKGIPSYFTTKDSDTQKIVLNFLATSCIKVEKTGYSSASIKVDVYYRVYGSGAEFTYHGTFKEWESEQSLSQLRASYTIDNLPPNCYELKLVKTTTDTTEKRQTDTYLVGFDEIKSYCLNYPNTALIGLKIRATNQLSGSLSSVKTLVKGRKVKVYTSATVYTTQWSENPVWCAYDYLCNKRYGMGKYNVADGMDLAELVSLAAYCDEQVAKEGASGTEPRFLLDMVLDSDQAGNDTLVRLCQTWRGVPIQDGGKIRLVIDKPETAVQQFRLFGMGNIIKGSFQSYWNSYSKVINTVELQYYDRFSRFEQDTITVYDEEALAAGKGEISNSVAMVGCTRQSQCARMGRYFVYSARADHGLKFKSSIEAIACRPMDVISVAHDLPAWGLASGRIIAATSTTVSLDREVTLDSLNNQSYCIKVMFSDDYVIVRQLAQPPGTYAAGTALQLAEAWPYSIPTADCNYQLGITNLEAKPFRVIEVRRTDDFEAELTVIEYVEAAYSDVAGLYTETQYTNLPSYRLKPEVVSDLKLTTGSSYYVQLYVSFAVPDANVNYGLYDHAEIYYSYDNVKWTLHGTTATNIYPMTGLTPNAMVYVRVYSVSTWGIKSTSYAGGNILTKSPAPSDVTGLEIFQQGNDTNFTGRDVVLNWKEVRSYTTADWPAGQDPGGAGTGSRDPYITGYQVKIIVNGKTTRISTVTEPTFTYSYDMNISDNGTPQRYFEARVYAMDAYGQYSKTPAVIYPYNAPPSAYSKDEDVYCVFSRMPTGFVGNWPHLVSWVKQALPDIAGYKVYRKVVTYGSETNSYSAGTVTIHSGSNVLTGIGTEWTKYVLPGDQILIDGWPYNLTIKRVISDTELVLVSAQAFSATNVSYSITVKDLIPFNNCVPDEECFYKDTTELSLSDMFYYPGSSNTYTDDDIKYIAYAIAPYDSFDDSTFFMKQFKVTATSITPYDIDTYRGNVIL